MKCPTGKITREPFTHYCNYSLGSGAWESGRLDPDPNAVSRADGLQSNIAILLMSLWRDQREAQTLQNDKCALNYTVTATEREYKIITGHALILEQITMEIIFFPYSLHISTACVT